jgi:hypothetical protein
MGDRDLQVSTLRTLACCVRAYCPWFAAIEANHLDSADVDRLQLYIDGLAAELERLADLVPEDTVTYIQVEALIAELHRAGFYPDKLAVKSVLHAFADESRGNSSDTVS